MRICKLFLIAIGFFLICISLALAQDKTTVDLPDLSIHSITFDPAPRDGQTIGTLKILIHNHGTAGAPENKLKFECLAVDCDDDNDCIRLSEALKCVITVPALKIDGEAELKWNPGQPLKWVKGNFIISAIVDPENTVRELHEENNQNQAVVYLKQFSPDTE